MSEISGLSVTEIDAEYIEPEALINLEALYQEKLARRPFRSTSDICAVCEAYEKILESLLK